MNRAQLEIQLRLVNDNIARTKSNLSKLECSRIKIKRELEEILE